MSSSYTAMLILLCAVLAAVTNALFIPVEPHKEEVHEEIGNIAGDDNAGDQHHQDYYSPPHYSYEYKVHDSHTGDIKTHHESRLGDQVKGYYTVKEADGTVREVHYTADKHNGFNAEVKTIGQPVHPAPTYHHSEPIQHQQHHNEEFSAAADGGHQF